MNGDITKQQHPPHAPDEKEYGEGNYKAAKQYDDATREFVESGRVGEAARKAAPKDAHEAREMAEAEARGRKRSKGEDLSAIKRAKSGKKR